MTNIPQNQLPTILQGYTSQVLDGLATTDGSLGNSSDVAAPGDANPQDTSGRPGYLAVGQPGGNPNDIIVPETDGNDASGGNILDVGAPAGTAGGGGVYPNITGSDGVQNPMITTGWTAQASTGDEFEQVVITTASPLTAATHGDAYSVTLAAAGGDGTYTWSLGTGSSLPSALTLASSTGVISGTPADAGSASFLVKVVDSDGNAAEKVFSLTIS